MEVNSLICIGCSTGKKQHNCSNYPTYRRIFNLITVKAVLLLYIAHLYNYSFFVLDVTERISAEDEQHCGQTEASADACVEGIRGSTMQEMEWDG